MKKLGLLFLSFFIISACGNDELKPSEVPNGTFDSDTEEFSSAADDLEVASITMIQNLDEVEVDSYEMTFKPMGDLDDVNGVERKGIFASFGQYTDEENNKYPFRAYISYTEDDFDSSFTPLYYSSEKSGVLVDILPEDVDR